MIQSSMIHSATEEFKERDGKKYLVLDSTEKYEEVFSGIKKKLKQWGKFMKRASL